MCNNCYRLRKRTVLLGEHEVFPSRTFFKQLLRLLVFKRFLFLFLNNWLVVSVRISTHGCTQMAWTACRKRKNCSREVKKIKKDLSHIMWLKKLNAMMWLNFFPSLGEISPSFAIFLFLTNFQGLTATSGYFFEDFAYL